MTLHMDDPATPVPVADASASLIRELVQIPDLFDRATVTMRVWDAIAAAISASLQAPRSAPRCRRRRCNEPTLQ